MADFFDQDAADGVGARLTGQPVGVDQDCRLALRTVGDEYGEAFLQAGVVAGLDGDGKPPGKNVLAQRFGGGQPIGARACPSTVEQGKQIGGGGLGGEVADGLLRQRVGVLQDCAGVFRRYPGLVLFRSGYRIASADCGRTGGRFTGGRRFGGGLACLLLPVPPVSGSVVGPVHGGDSSRAVEQQARFQGQGAGSGTKVGTFLFGHG